MVKRFPTFFAFILRRYRGHVGIFIASLLAFVFPAAGGASEPSPSLYCVGTAKILDSLLGRIVIGGFVNSSVEFRIRRNGQSLELMPVKLEIRVPSDFPLSQGWRFPIAHENETELRSHSLDNQKREWVLELNRISGTFKLMLASNSGRPQPFGPTIYLDVDANCRRADPLL